MQRVAVVAALDCASGQGQYPVVLRQCYPGIVQGPLHNLVKQRLVRRVLRELRLDVAKCRRRLVEGEDLPNMVTVQRLHEYIAVILEIFTGKEKTHIMEHGPVLHVVSVDHRVLVKRGQTVLPIEKQGTGIAFSAVYVLVKVEHVVACLHDRVPDVRVFDKDIRDDIVVSQVTAQRLDIQRSQGVWWYIYRRIRDIYNIRRGNVG